MLGDRAGMAGDEVVKPLAAAEFQSLRDRLHGLLDAPWLLGRNSALQIGQSPAVPLRGGRAGGSKAPRRCHQRPIVISNIGDLGGRQHLYAYCNACRQSIRLDLDGLRERYGAGLLVKRLRPRLSCSCCGARALPMFFTFGTPARRPAPELFQLAPGYHQALGREVQRRARDCSRALGFGLALEFGPVVKIEFQHHAL